jgi:hypothetical protein
MRRAMEMGFGTMSRQERLKSALRDNLKRRKEQARGRAQTTDGAERPDAPKSPAQKDDGEGA